MEGARPAGAEPVAPAGAKVSLVGAEVSPARRTWVRKSSAAIMTEVDPAIGEVLGWGADDLVGKTSLEFVHPDDQALAIENWMQMLASPGEAPPLRIRHRHAGGHWVWVEMVNDNRLDDPSERCVVAEMTDVSAEMAPAWDGADGAPGGMGAHDGAAGARSAAGEQGRAGPAATVATERPRQVHEIMRRREQVLHRLSEALPVGVLHVDGNGRVLYSNNQMHVIAGRPRATTFIEQLARVLPEDELSVVEAFESALRSGLDNDIEIRLATSDAPSDKDVRQCTLSVRTLVGEDGSIIGAVACLADVTESARMRDELRMQATFDKLTGCYNRASTMSALEKMVAARDTSRPAVVFIDVDDLKGINDRLGHTAGDEVLQIIGGRLKRAVREGDVVGRIGGDEFLVLCPRIASTDEAMRAATRVSDSLSGPMKLRAGEVACRASVGVEWSGASGLEADTLIGRADTAMYEAKRSGLGRPVMYRPAPGES